VDASGNAVKEPVSVDGQPQGSSPLQLKLPIGEHVVEAGGQRQTVRLVEKQVETVVLTVERAAGQPAGTTMTGPLPGMVFVTIPAGTFQMGSPGSESGRDSDEGPQHQVTLSSYAMMTTEVTQAQWQAMMGSNPSYFKGDDRPVEQVSWNVVQDFITKLNQRDPGKGYRLPTEAEWEFACRAGSTGRWCFGDDEAQLDDYAWTYTNSGDRPLTEDWDVNQLSPNNCRTHPVGQKRANAWGMYDLHGNVWEWCQDWYGNYSRGAVTDPTGAASGSLRVRRGGCWEYTAGYCRSAFRGYVGPSNRNNNLGFRVARTLP